MNNVVTEKRLCMNTVEKFSNSRATIPALDGVRAVATLAVVTFHINGLVHNKLWSMQANPLASAIMTFGGSGVTLFFVLSGFLLFLPYARALLFEERWPSLRQFYLKRALRIIPGYYAALCLIILFFKPQYLQLGRWQELLLFVTFFMDSTPQTSRQLNGPFWTLAVEWQFYLLLPWLALLFGLVIRRIAPSFRSPQSRFKLLLLCCAGLITWSLSIRYLGIYLTQHPSETFHLPPGIIATAKFFLYGMQGKYLENFAVGMAICLCYVFAHRLSNDSALLAWAKGWSWWLWGGGILLLTLMAGWHFHVLVSNATVLRYVFAPFTPVFDLLNEMVIALGYGACLVAILFGERSLQRLFELPLLRQIGMISYGLYMWHLPLLNFFRNAILPHSVQTQVYPAYVSYWLWAIIVIMPVAVASYVMVEKPWMRLAMKRS
jgi:peptidoglycan/LPS O-acetylase OafA/YrhL